MDFNDRIAALAELEKHVMPLNWETFGAADENIVDSNGLFVAETCSDDDAALIVALRNEALPLLREMAQALSEARAERDALQVRVDGALAILNEQSGNPFGSQYYDNEIEFYEGMRESLQRLLSGKQDGYLKVFERLTGEGES